VAAHFNWTEFIPGVHHGNVHVATAACVSLFLIVLSVLARVSLGSGEKAIEPVGRFSIRGIFEALSEGLLKLGEMVIGENAWPYVPLFICVFFFILVNNITGLLPGMTPATDNINTTFAVGVFVFIFYNFVGLYLKRAHYLGDYTGHLPLKGPMLLVALLVFPIELLSHGFRPVSLGLRLAGNMRGDHAVLGVFLDILPSPLVYFVPIVFYALGLLVCIIQATVFTLLSMCYVMMAQDFEEH